MSDKLRECPFCRKTEQEKRTGETFTRGVYFYQLICDKCITMTVHYSSSEKGTGWDKLFNKWNTRHEPKHETVEHEYLPCCATCTKWADSIHGMHCTDIHKQVLRDDWCCDYVSIELPTTTVKRRTYEL